MSKKGSSGGSRNERTSPRVATIASNLLSNPKTPANVKTVAASVLTQTPNKSSGGKQGK